MAEYLPAFFIFFLGPLVIGYLIYCLVSWWKKKLSAARPLYTKKMQVFNEEYGTLFPTDPKKIDPRLILGGNTDDLLFKFGDFGLFSTGNLMFFEPTSGKVAVYRNKVEGIQVHNISWIKSAEHRYKTTTSGPAGIQSRTRGSLTVGTSDVLSPTMSFAIHKEANGFEWVKRIDALLS